MGKSKKLRRLIKAAKMGKPYAQYQIAIRYQTGWKMPQNLQAAAAWMKLAANSEYAPAKEWLADYTFDDDANTQANA